MSARLSWAFVSIASTSARLAAVAKRISSAMRNSPRVSAIDGGPALVGWDALFLSAQVCHQSSEGQFVIGTGGGQLALPVVVRWVAVGTGEAAVAEVFAGLVPRCV